MVIRAFETRSRLTARFLSKPLGDLCPRPPMIVVQVDDHRCQRQPFRAALRTLFRHLVEASKQPFEMIGNQLAMFARQAIHAFVHRAQGARAALFIEVAAEALRAAAGARADVFREFALFALEFCRHGESPPTAVRAIAIAIYVPGRDCSSAEGLTRLMMQT